MLNYILKLYIFLIISLNSCNIFANIWDDLLSATCGIGQSDISESWNGKTKTFSPNMLCAPFNKEDGRSGTCLEQFDFPSVPTAYYFNICAQATNQSTYFKPAITIVSQACNSLVCWPLTQVLEGHGDCAIFPSPYGAPLSRMCARVASPEVKNSKDATITNTRADMGYTNDIHLNLKGENVNDIYPQGVIDKNQYRRPKLCAYNDPGLVTFATGNVDAPDLLDYDPGYQPLHKTDKLAPLARVLLLILDFKRDMSPAGLISKLLDLLGVYNMPGLDVLQKVLEFVIILTNLYESLFIEIVKAVGSLNGMVRSDIYGCVELPLGPMPPPYCPVLTPLTSTATVAKICTEKYPGTDIFKQDISSNCVISKLENNIINNVIRVSFDYTIRLCSPEEDPYKTDRCVALQNIPLTLSDQYSPIVPICTDANDTRFCVKTSIKNSPKEVRLAYVRGKASASYTNYFVSYINYPDIKMEYCSDTSNSGICQKIYGVNMNSYVDIAVRYPEDQKPNNYMTISKEFSLSDILSKDQNFVARIVYNKTNFGDYEQQPTQICVYNVSDNSLVGCVDRTLENYEIIVTDSNQCSKYNIKSCPANDYYNPLAILSIKSGNDITSTIITPLSMHSNPPPLKGILPKKTYLAGLEFSPQIIELRNEIYNAKPFSGKRAYSSNSIFGEYKNDEKPIDISGKPTNAVYIKGLEVNQDRYIQGGTHICAVPVNTNNISTMCLPGIYNQNCILAKLYNPSAIDCVKSRDLLQKYPNILACRDLEKNSCTIENQIGGVQIMKCSASTPDTYCYNGDLSTILCPVSYALKDRIYPSADFGNVLSSSQYYQIPEKQFEDKNGIKTLISPYDENLQGTRAKTSLEMGLCTKLPDTPTCKAITSPSSKDGNASWPETPMGEVSTGVCMEGYVEENGKKLERYCLSKIDNKSTLWDDIKDQNQCISDKQITISNIQHDFDVENKNPYRSETTKFNYLTPSDYDKKTKIGTFAFLLEQDSNIKTAGSSGYSTAFDRVPELTFDLNILDVSKLEYFKFTKILYDDYYILYVNGSRISSDPAIMDNVVFGKMFPQYMTFQSGILNISFKGKASNIIVKSYPDTNNRHIVENIDLLPYLKNGKNNIKISVGVVGGGKLNYNIEYKLK